MKESERNKTSTCNREVLVYLADFHSNVLEWSNIFVFQISTFFRSGEKDENAAHSS